MDGKKALLLGSAVVVAAAAVVLTRAEAGPEEPAPSGELTLELYAAEPYTVDDVKGQALTAALVRLTGKAFSGTPAPDMILELYDNDALKSTVTNLEVALNTEYLLDTDFTSPADLGSHAVYGLMTLTNEVGTIQYQTNVVTFEIGEAPTGEITITVT